jgi:hypothetical protein
MQEGTYSVFPPVFCHFVMTSITTYQNITYFWAYLLLDNH